MCSSDLFDNHILYAAILGYSIPQLYELTRKIVIDNNRNAFFAQAYNLSYADIWEISSVKQGLKKFEIDLGIHHMKPVTLFLISDGRSWAADQEEKYEADLCDRCRTKLLHTFFRIPADIDAELPTFLSTPVSALDG